MVVRVHPRGPNFIKEFFMRLTNSKEIMEFRYAVAKCKGDVWLED